MLARRVRTRRVQIGFALAGCGVALGTLSALAIVDAVFAVVDP